MRFVPRESPRLGMPLEELSTYRFNRHVIDHHFCSDCGCAPFGFGVAPDGTATAAVNIRCIEGVDLTALKRVPVDGRSY